MKRNAKYIAALLLFALIAALSSLIPSSALYNDVTFESYTNMSADSAIPSLFRNDAVFPQYKQHPPVITDGIEYVPLEIFYGLSGIKISYSDDGSNFYIQNKNTNRYISFSIAGEYAVTGSGDVYEVKVHTFYDVHYVPLRTTCSATGIGCDSYNDGINKLYVIKVYTVPGLSAKELITIHAPGIYETEEDGESENPTDAPIIEVPNIPDEDENKDGDQTGGKTEKPEVFPQRTVYLLFEDSLENASDTLDTLKSNRVKAVFFLYPDEIRIYPDTVRRIYTEGHTIAIALRESPSDICTEGALEESCRLALDMLYEVTKTKTRIITLPRDSEGLYEAADIYDRIEKLGLQYLSANLDGKTDTLSAYAATRGLTDSLRSLERTHRTTKAYIKLTHSDAGRGTAAGLVSLSAANPTVKISLFDETE